MPTFEQLASFSSTEGAMPNPETLYTGNLYHIYNRGNNRETLFYTDANYRFFLKRYQYYVDPVAKTLAYCLLPNHFHLMVYLRVAGEQRAWHNQHQLPEPWLPIKPHIAFKNLFIAYAMAINKQENRTGSLFQKPFKRKRIDTSRYASALVSYIHRNPQKHNLIGDYRLWPWSSYEEILSGTATWVDRAATLAWFNGNRDDFIAAQQDTTSDYLIAPADDLTGTIF